MTKKRRVITQRKTLLIVGEGITEVAFLTYLRQLYCTAKQGPKVTVKNAYGKGPEHVVHTAIGYQTNRRVADFDQIAAVLDTDIPWTEKLVAEAKRHHILLIGNSPCIEGTFLAMLGQKIPATSAACKAQLQKRINSSLFTAEDYTTWCTRELLEQSAQHHSELAKLLAIYR